MPILQLRKLRHREVRYPTSYGGSNRVQTQWSSPRVYTLNQAEFGACVPIRVPVCTLGFLPENVPHSSGELSQFDPDLGRCVWRQEVNAESWWGGVWTDTIATGKVSIKKKR